MARRTSFEGPPTMLKSLLLFSLPLACLAGTIRKLQERQISGPMGIDVSHFQGTIDWTSVAANGISFVFIKATEGTTFLDPDFSDNYIGATDAGLIRGGYHFAHPDISSGATQATYFLAHGGGWSADGITLPGMLDIEYNPSGDECYDLSTSAMVSWIQDFSNTYESQTGRFPIIYTTTDWWTTCTGNSALFANDNPLFIAHYASSIGTIPAGWSFATFWQYSDSGANPGDQDVFNGSAAGLKLIAQG
ncbi:MAG: glycoside hydrolase family 25 protein [Lentinula lateritia]|uniref:Lysozyme n=1 Tax=Lentinula lateritia TaxID=40482 RepID=A0ABQ8VBU1_9AGAR|nr:MAG: glycoside hydrolase family 25 protein [Lentinula lateritia]KAJ4486821.1 N,O-diacetylmuramidase [Lentinula lateritia]